MQRTLTITQTATGLMLLASGGAKLAGNELTKQQFDRFGYPQWFRLAAGATEVTAAAGLLAGLRDPRAAIASGLLTCGTMVGAIWTHLVRARDPAIYAAPAVALLGAAAWITAAHSANLAQPPQAPVAKRPTSASGGTMTYRRRRRGTATRTREFTSASRTGSRTNLTWRKRPSRRCCRYLSS